MKILLLMFMLSNALYAKDRSGFTINAGSFDQPVNYRYTKIHFIVTDSLGRKTGFKSFFKYEEGDIGINTYKEIPHSGYLTESVGSLDPSVVPDEPESASFGINGPIMRDTYTITIIGLGNVKYFADMHLTDTEGKVSSVLNDGYILEGTTHQYSIFLDPTPGAPPPVLTKVVTFQTLRDDFNVSYNLNQIGDDKFVKSLIRMVDIAEMISKRCDKLNDKAKHRCYRPVVVILRMVVKRLEVVNRLCDNQTDCKPKCKVSKECDEDEVLKMFESKYRKNDDLKDFFDSWDKDEWHKHKKKCKRFITDEALEIVSADVNWLIKSFGDDVWENYKKEHEPYIPEKYKNFFK